MQMNKKMVAPLRPPLFAAFFLSSVLALAAAPLHAELAVNLPPPATDIAREIYDLHTLVLWICVGIFFLVFIPMFWAVARHRRSRGAVAEQFHEHPELEFTWTIAPLAIVLSLALPATQTVLAMKDTSAPDLTVKVTGHQWKWEYEYLGSGVRYFSQLATPAAQWEGTAAKSPHYLLEVDRPLVVPTGKKVRLVLTATDVIHAWWIPAFGVKQDAIPGFIRDSWFRVDHPGTYRGQCAELCGVGHAYMPVVVEALPPGQFAAWLQDQRTAQQASLAAAQDAGSRTWTLAELKERGAAVYQTHCSACHGREGQGVPGAFPALSGSPLVNGPPAAHLARVMQGKPGTAMAAFAGQLNDVEIAAVVSFERNSWQNHTGDLVQPAEVAAMRAAPGQPPTAAAR